MNNARNEALHDTVPSAASPPGGGRSSSLPAISSARPRPLSTAPSAFFLCCIIFTSSCVPVFCCTLRALVDEERQERGPAHHGLGRRQPENSSSPLIFLSTCWTHARKNRPVGVQRHHQVSSPPAASRCSDTPSRPAAAMPRRWPRTRSRTRRPPPPDARTPAPPGRHCPPDARTPAPSGRRPLPPPATRSGVGRTAPPRSS